MKSLLARASLNLGLVLLAFGFGCSSTPPPAPVPPARQQAQFVAASALKLSQAGNWVAAAREWQEAADQFSALNDLGNEAVALHNLAQADRELDRLDAAQHLLDRAATLNQQAGQTNEWWRDQIALLQVESREEQTAPIEARFKRLVPLLPKVEDPQLRGLFLNEFAQWQQRQEHLNEAAQTYQQAEQAFVQAARPQGVAAVSANRASLYLAQTNYPAALKEWSRALAEYEAIAEPFGITRALEGQGRTMLVAKQDLPEAEELLRRAARNFQTLRKPGYQVDALLTLIDCLKARNEPLAEAQRELARAREAYAADLEKAEQWTAAGEQWKAAADLWQTLDQPAARNLALAGVQRCSRQQ
ncbi:MAG: hypothetical protein M1608_16795 [Candidatus Omnitrophica bacterium]|nr:hypothetical protein [Candidatus Omnitrophota bacterium]